MYEKDFSCVCKAHVKGACIRFEYMQKCIFDAWRCAHACMGINADAGGGHRVDARQLRLVPRGN